MKDLQCPNRQMQDIATSRHLLEIRASIVRTPSGRAIRFRGLPTFLRLHKPIYSPKGYPFK